MSVICLSIEPMNGKTYQYGFHLGTDFKLAMQIGAEKFAALNKYRETSGGAKTVALMFNGEVLCVYESASEGWEMENAGLMLEGAQR